MPDREPPHDPAEPSVDAAGLAGRIAALFDRIEAHWSADTTRRWVTRSLVVAFLVSIGLIELARQGIAPTVLGHPMPTNHFHAISWVVTLLLVVEVLDLIFGLAGSISGAIGKQLEIFSLVLLRKTFDVLPSFPEPIQVAGQHEALLQMGAQAGASLVVFALLIAFYRVQRGLPPSSDRRELASYIAFKKLVCLVLLLAFVVVGALAGVSSLTLEDPDATLSLRFFELWYTVLIFADVALVLASLESSLGYSVVFRNFGFAAVTVFVRFGLAAEPYTNAILGIASALFALGLAAAFAMARHADVRLPPRDAEA